MTKTKSWKKSEMVMRAIFFTVSAIGESVLRVVWFSRQVDELVL